jgi:hypothetical protein
MSSSISHRQHTAETRKITESRPAFGRRMIRRIDYWDYAEECRRLADSTNTVDLQTQLLQIATEWESLASATRRPNHLSAAKRNKTR